MIHKKKIYFLGSVTQSTKSAKTMYNYVAIRENLIRSEEKHISMMAVLIFVTQLLYHCAVKQSSTKISNIKMFVLLFTVDAFQKYLLQELK